MQKTHVHVEYVEYFVQQRDNLNEEYQLFVHREYRLILIAELIFDLLFHRVRAMHKQLNDRNSRDQLNDLQLYAMLDKIQDI